jgi:hypothetical protein
VLAGCFADTPPTGCRATSHVTLSASQRAELTALWTDVTRMPRCEPAAFAPGDPEFVLSAGASTYRGHLPASSADLPSRAAGPCAADVRLAAWLARVFPA